MTVTLIDPHLFIVIVLAECVCTDRFENIDFQKHVLCAHTITKNYCRTTGTNIFCEQARADEYIFYITLALLSSDSTIKEGWDPRSTRWMDWQCRHNFFRYPPYGHVIQRVGQPAQFYTLAVPFLHQQS